MTAFNLHGWAWRIWVWGCYLSFASFLFLASRNAHALAQAVRGDGTTGMRYTPGWTVAWFFVPVAFWFKPYSAVKELWLVSGLRGVDDDGRDTSTPWYLPLWWAVWVLVPILRAVSGKLSQTRPRLVSVTSEILLNAGTGLVLVALAGLAWSVVRSIYRRQQDSATELGYIAAKAAT